MSCDAYARITDGDLGMISTPAESHGNSAMKREFERVREQIQNDLLPHVAVDVDRLWQLGTVHVEREPRALDRGTERARQIDGQHTQIRRLVRGLRAAGLDPRKIQQSIDELQQAQLIAVHGLQLRAFQRLLWRAECVFRSE